MLTSPQTITIGGVAHSLSRINEGGFSSTWLKKADGLEIRMVIRHSYEKATPTGQYERHNVELTHTTWDEDGRMTVDQSYFVTRKLRGTADTTAVDLTKALAAWGTTNAASIIGWES